LVAIWKEDPTGNPTLEQVAAFAYDALNRRIEEDILGLGGGSVGRDRRTWVYDGWRIVSEIGYSSSTLQDDPASPGDLVRARNVYGAGRDEILFAERDLDSMGLDTQLIPVTDFLGSTERVLDTAGGVEERYEYSPYGLQMVFQSGTMQPATQVDYRVGYTGHRTELLIAASRQLTYARNRVYDPENGRFLQQDPLGFTDGPNVYQYATSAPVRNTDPYGLSASFGGMSSINSCPGEVKPKKTFGGGGGIRSGPPPASPPMPRMGGGHGIAVFMPRAENKRDAEFFKTKKQAEETQESNKSWRQRSGEALMTLAKNDPQAAMLLQKKYNLDASFGHTASVTVSDPTFFTLDGRNEGSGQGYLSRAGQNWVDTNNAVPGWVAPNGAALLLRGSTSIGEATGLFTWTDWIQSLRTPVMGTGSGAIFTSALASSCCRYLESVEFGMESVY
jgi:RHS repeat-associated protein